MKQAIVPIKGIWSERPVLDWPLAAIVVAIHAVALHRGWVHFQLAHLVKDDRMRVYVAMATVSSLLFGFATASIAFFYGSARGERVELLKRVLNEQLVRTWRSALSAPLIAVAIAMGALALDTSTGGRPWIGWTVEAAVFFLGLRAFRLRWLFVSTLNLLSHDIQNPPTPTVSTPTGEPPRAAARPRRRDAEDAPAG